MDTIPDYALGLLRKLRDSAVSISECPLLDCQCAIVSTAICQILQELNPKLSYGLFKGEEHCWVEIGDTIVDLTATQFCEPEEILICNRNDKRYALKRYILKMSWFKAWPREQRPNKSVVKLIIEGMRNDKRNLNNDTL